MNTEQLIDPEPAFVVTEVVYENSFNPRTMETTFETCFVLDHKSKEGFDRIVFAFRENEEFKSLLLQLFNSDVGTFSFKGEAISGRPGHCRLKRLWQIR